MKRRQISSLSELETLEKTVVAAAHATAQRLTSVLRHPDALAALVQIKFAASGCDPLEPERPLNFVEQLNQSFTYIASVEATRWLLEHHAEHAPFVLNLGTSPGSDVASANGAVAAEVFAATHPDSNDKLRKDIAKVASLAARYRYVFYLSPVAANHQASDVTVVRLHHPSMPQSGTPDA